LLKKPPKRLRKKEAPAKKPTKETGSKKSS
jgi:hypothetical protein